MWQRMRWVSARVLDVQLQALTELGWDYVAVAVILLLAPSAALLAAKILETTLALREKEKSKDIPLDGRRSGRHGSECRRTLGVAIELGVWRESNAEPRA